MAPTVWSSAPGANGHSYEVFSVPAGIDWDEAEALAISQGGHSSSITSEESTLWSARARLTGGAGFRGQRHRAVDRRLSTRRRFLLTPSAADRAVSLVLMAGCFGTIRGCCGKHPGYSDKAPDCSDRVSGSSDKVPPSSDNASASSDSVSASSDGASASSDKASRCSDNASGTSDSIPATPDRASASSDRAPGCSDRASSCFDGIPCCFEKALSSGSLAQCADAGWAKGAGREY